MSKGNKRREVAKIVSVFSVVGKQVSISMDNIEKGNGMCKCNTALVHPEKQEQAVFKEREGTHHNAVQDRQCTSVNMHAISISISNRKMIFKL